MIPTFDENQLKFRRPPPLSVAVDFVYGFESYDKRSTLHYAHTYFNDEGSFGFSGDSTFFSLGAGGGNSSSFSGVGVGDNSGGMGLLMNNNPNYNQNQQQT